MSDVMMLCESVLVGVIFGCFQLGSDAKLVKRIYGQRPALAVCQVHDTRRFL